MTDWLREPVAPLDAAARERARARQAQLTKPPGSLGQLETVAETLAAMQGRDAPRVERVQVAVFAADHGVAAEAVSAFPQAVTAEMVRNFARGGAAVSVLARELGAGLTVYNVGTVEPVEALPGVEDRRIAPGSGNIAREPAMTADQLEAALAVGREAVDRALEAGCDLFVAGEMGIANTTAATAIACAVFDAAPQDFAGPGTGLDRAGVARKALVVQQALNRARAHIEAPWDILRELGGLEIAAIAGAYLRAAQRGLPFLVDGYIASAALLVLTRARPEVRDWALFGHASAEPAHRRLLSALEARPLLDLGMRLGEGSGALAAVPVLRLACALHNGMATFSEAGVSQGDA